MLKLNIRNAEKGEFPFDVDTRCTRCSRLRIQYRSLLTIKTNWIKANYIGNNCLHGHARICLSL